MLANPEAFAAAAAAAAPAASSAPAAAAAEEPAKKEEEDESDDDMVCTCLTLDGTSPYRHLAGLRSLRLDAIYTHVVMLYIVARPKYDAGRARTTVSTNAPHSSFADSECEV